MMQNLTQRASKCRAQELRVHPEDREYRAGLENLEDRETAPDPDRAVASGQDRELGLDFDQART